MDDDRYKLARQRGNSIVRGWMVVDRTGNWLTPKRLDRRKRSLQALFLELLDEVEVCRDGRCESADH
jgi:hypothetical protein